jgi:hypothetical protein
VVQIRKPPSGFLSPYREPGVVDHGQPASMVSVFLHQSTRSFTAAAPMMWLMYNSQTYTSKIDSRINPNFERTIRLYHWNLTIG